MQNKEILTVMDKARDAGIRGVCKLGQLEEGEDQLWEPALDLTRKQTHLCFYASDSDWSWRSTHAPSCLSALRTKFSSHVIWCSQEEVLLCESLNFCLGTFMLMVPDLCSVQWNAPSTSGPPLVDWMYWSMWSLHFMLWLSYIRVCVMLWWSILFAVQPCTENSISHCVQWLPGLVMSQTKPKKK